MIIELDSETHPKAQILQIDLERGSFDFRWLGGPYDGVCVSNVAITSLETAGDEVKAALEKETGFTAKVTRKVESTLTPTEAQGLLAKIIDFFKG